MSVFPHAALFCEILEMDRNMGNTGLVGERNGGGNTGSSESGMDEIGISLKMLLYE